MIGNRSGSLSKGKKKKKIIILPLLEALPLDLVPGEIPSFTLACQLIDVVVLDEHWSIRPCFQALAVTAKLIYWPTEGSLNVLVPRSYHITVAQHCSSPAFQAGS